MLPVRGQPGELRKIIPDHLASWAAIRKAVKRRYKLARHHFLYHLVRVPLRLVAHRQVGSRRLRPPGVHADQLVVGHRATYLRLEAVAANDPRQWLALHKHARKTRLVRGMVLLAELAGARAGLRDRDLLRAAGMVADPRRARAAAGVGGTAGGQADPGLRRRPGAHGAAVK